jgi:hypothetical protein
MIHRIADIAGLTAAALLLLVPTMLFFMGIFAIAEGLLWCMLYFTQ